MDVQVCLEPLDSVLPAESDTELTGHADGTDRRDAAQPDEQAPAPHVPCMWKRLAGRPTAAGAVPSPGQVRFITWPKSRTMRATRQLSPPPK